MNQKPTIQSIKKCIRYTRNLSLREKDDSIGIETNECSTFLSWSGLLA